MTKVVFLKGWQDLEDIYRIRKQNKKSKNNNEQSFRKNGKNKIL